eukprot:XP_001694935.1 predicted protein [Chlamydomonas reinhardtii]
MAAAAVAPPDEKFLKLREENERRRKKKEEEEKRRKQDEELKTKEALERRRLERVEQDERMRKPWQQPPAPKKPILRKGAKSKPSQPPTPSAADPMRKSQQEEKRKELRQGLQDFIRQQRQAAVAPKNPAGAGGGGGGGGNDGAPVVPLTWEELRLAAEAGFDELVRQQEEDAEQRAEDPVAARATRHRSPYKSPFRGAPAPPQETVQVALVPTQQHAPIAAAAHVPDTPTTAVPATADRMAALRTSYKFSDAPGWTGQHPAALQQHQPQRVGLDAGTGGGPMATTPAAVLYPPGDGPEAATGSGDVGAASSVASSGGLRRGVTAAARYRVAPLDAETLDSAAEDPWGRDNAAAGGAVVDAGSGGAGEGVGAQAPLQQPGSPGAHYGDDPPMPAWAQAGSGAHGGGAAPEHSGAWAGGEAGGGLGESGADFGGEVGLDMGASGGLAGAGVQTAVRHSIGVGDSGGPAMWQRESVTLPRASQAQVQRAPADFGTPALQPRHEDSEPQFQAVSPAEVQQSVPLVPAVSPAHGPEPGARLSYNDVPLQGSPALTASVASSTTSTPARAPSEAARSVSLAASSPHQAPAPGVVSTERSSAVGAEASRGLQSAVDASEEAVRASTGGHKQGLEDAVLGDVAEAEHEPWVPPMLSALPPPVNISTDGLPAAAPVVLRHEPLQGSATGAATAALTHLAAMAAGTALPPVTAAASAAPGVATSQNDKAVLPPVITSRPLSGSARLPPLPSGFHSGGSMSGSLPPVAASAGSMTGTPPPKSQPLSASGSAATTSTSISTPTTPPQQQAHALHQPHPPPMRAPSPPGSPPRNGTPQRFHRQLSSSGGSRPQSADLAERSAASMTAVASAASSTPSALAPQPPPQAPPAHPSRPRSADLVAAASAALPASQAAPTAGAARASPPPALNTTPLPLETPAVAAAAVPASPRVPGVVVTTPASGTSRPHRQLQQSAPVAQAVQAVGAGGRLDGGAVSASRDSALPVEENSAVVVIEDDKDSDIQADVEVYMDDSGLASPSPAHTSLGAPAQPVGAATVTNMPAAVKPVGTAASLSSKAEASPGPDEAETARLQQQQQHLLHLTDASVLPSRPPGTAGSGMGSVMSGSHISAAPLSEAGSSSSAGAGGAGARPGSAATAGMMGSGYQASLLGMLDDSVSSFDFRVPRALKAEFEGMGHGEAVAGLQTLSANFTAAAGSNGNGASATASPAHYAGPTQGNSASSAPEAVGIAGAAAAAAQPAPAPLLQWGFGGGAQPPPPQQQQELYGTAPAYTVPPPMPMQQQQQPFEQHMQMPAWAALVMPPHPVAEPQPVQALPQQHPHQPVAQPSTAQAPYGAPWPQADSAQRHTQQAAPPLATTLPSAAATLAPGGVAAAAGSTKRALGGHAGGAGYAALDSPGSVSELRHGTRSGTGTASAPKPAMAAAERPLINDGSYARAAVEARERAERERAAREALAAETAAAKAAALQRSKSEHRTGGGGGTPSGGASTSPTAGTGSGATKAPSAIGSYVRQPSPLPARPTAPFGRSTSTGRDTGARGGVAAEPSSSGTTPTGTRAASRIPTPPRPRDAGAAGVGATGGKQLAVDESYDSDLDFLERALDASDTETDTPSPPRQGARREAFASPSSATAAAAAAANAAAYRERLAERSGHSGTSGKPVTPFTAAIRELMGLPGSAPLEQSRAAAGAAVGRGGQLLDARGQWPSRLTDEEDRLLASLKRLDAEVLKRDQLRESLDRLDSQLGALRRKMEAAAITPGKPAASTRPRDITPTKTPEERRGPPATLAKSRTPTPNKAKAIRDQRQQQLTSHQGATPPAARTASGTASAPPKPASAPVMGAMGGVPAVPAAAQYQQGPIAASSISPPPASASAVPSAGYSGIPQGPANGVASGVSGAQPHGMPPRAPPARAPATYGAMPGGGAHVMNPYGTPSSPGGGGSGAPQGMLMPPPPQHQNLQQPQQQPQVAYVPTMLPNGQMAYVPQYVMPGGGGSYMQSNMGFPQMMMQPTGMQSPQLVMAWGASPPPSAQAVPMSPAGPSLYSFDRSSSNGTPPQVASGGGVQGGGAELAAPQSTREPSVQFQSFGPNGGSRGLGPGAAWGGGAAGAGAGPADGGVIKAGNLGLLFS